MLKKYDFGNEKRKRNGPPFPPQKSADVLNVEKLHGLGFHKIIDFYFNIVINATKLSSISRLGEFRRCGR